VSATQEVSKRLSLTYGLRYSLFYRLGSSTVNIYENNSPVTFNTDLQIYEKAIPTGTKFYNKNEVIQSYDNLEPRFSASYQLNDAQSIKASYNRMTQYLQLISTSSLPTRRMAAK
jgi:outer membrane receptor protein involved in Fe transport